MLGALSPLIRLAVYAAVVAGALGTATVAYVGWRHHQQMIGWNGAIDYMKAKDATARRVGDQAINSVDACDNSGGTWNVSTGKCDP